MAAIVTGWRGDEWRAIAELTVPRMSEYAARHGHTFSVYQFNDTIARPASWHKLLAIADAFSVADRVLWLDADVLIVDGSNDIAAELPAGKCQAMVRHACPGGDVPNAGVWFLDRSMLCALMTCAMQDVFVHHKWWEQAAILSLMGFSESDGRCRHETATPLYEGTQWLDESWNVWRGSPSSVRPRFVHACGVKDDRLGYLKGLA